MFNIFIDKCIYIFYNIYSIFVFGGGTLKNEYDEDIKKINTRFQKTNKRLEKLAGLNAKKLSNFLDKLTGYFEKSKYKYSPAMIMKRIKRALNCIDKMSKTDDEQFEKLLDKIKDALPNDKDAKELNLNKKKLSSENKKELVDNIEIILDKDKQDQLQFDLVHECLMKIIDSCCHFCYEVTQYMKKGSLATLTKIKERWVKEKEVRELTEKELETISKLQGCIGLETNRLATILSNAILGTHGIVPDIEKKIKDNNKVLKKKWYHYLPFVKSPKDKQIEKNKQVEKSVKNLAETLSGNLKKTVQLLGDSVFNGAIPFKKNNSYYDICPTLSCNDALLGVPCCKGLFSKNLGMPPKL